MISDGDGAGRGGAVPDRAFVWTWPAGETRPVVAGALVADAGRYRFNYARSWLSRPGAVPLHVPELPLVTGAIEPLPGLSMAGALRDASPDAWGRRVIAARLARDDASPAVPSGDEPSELDCLLLSGSDRIGGLDFQASATVYAARGDGTASLDELNAAADLVDRGEPLPEALELALRHGTSIGGARPKALPDGSPVSREVHAGFCKRPVPSAYSPLVSMSNWSPWTTA